MNNIVYVIFGILTVVVLAFSCNLFVLWFKSEAVKIEQPPLPKIKLFSLSERRFGLGGSGNKSIRFAVGLKYQKETLNAAKNILLG
ncbi:MAG: hypothetical protein LBK66_01285 [Spirochaetaceae bacterium]|jgi:hypothetical protein|nr:hypothetical protein [Spirochaetaceae bacterium]